MIWTDENRRVTCRVRYMQRRVSSPHTRSSFFVPEPKSSIHIHDSSTSNDIPENDPATFSSSSFLPPDLPAFLGLVREMTLVATRNALVRRWSRWASLEYKRAWAHSKHPLERDSCLRIREMISLSAFSSKNPFRSERGLRRGSAGAATDGFS